MHLDHSCIRFFKSYIIKNIIGMYFKVNFVYCKLKKNYAWVRAYVFCEASNWSKIKNNIKISVILNISDKISCLGPIAIQVYSYSSLCKLQCKYLVHLIHKKGFCRKALLSCINGFFGKMFIKLVSM